MIFRAVFWIGLVALLLPREPDLGLGRPAGFSLLYAFQDKAMRGLATVKADLDSNRKVSPL